MALGPPLNPTSILRLLWFTEDQSEYRWAAQVAQWQRAGLPMQQTKETRVHVPGWEDPRSRKQQPAPAFLPQSPMDRGAWWAPLHRAKSQTVLSRHADPNTVAPGPKESFPFTRQSGQADRLQALYTFLL